MRIAITGTPGVGKTTTAQELSEYLGFTHVNVSEVASDMGAVITKEGDTSVVNIDILKEKLDMDDIIIDSHFAEVFEVDFVFVLRCEPKVLYKRLEERGYSKEKIKENVMAEILDYCLVNSLIYHEPEQIFEVYTNFVEEIVLIVENPQRQTKRSLAYGSRTHFLTEENLQLVE
ncbi:MAG: adenylate kinase family protein [Candidatus Methanofastidiosia archaeon]|jgi:adenylate kinase